MPTREANDDSFPQFVQYFMMASRLRMRIPSLPSLREFIKTFVRASGRVAGSMKCFAVPLLFNKTSDDDSHRLEQLAHAALFHLK